MERDPYEAAKNRVRIGTAPQFGARVFGAVEDIPPGQWHKWKQPHAVAVYHCRASCPRPPQPRNRRPLRAPWRIEVITCDWCPAEWVGPVGASWRRVECPDCGRATSRGLVADTVWSEGR